MKILFFDTETTGLPPRKRVLDVTTWPSIVQLSYIIYDPDADTVLKIYDSVVKVKEDVVISEGSVALHGISRAISQEKGREIEFVLDDFYEDVTKVDLVVAHNMDFDLNVMKVEFMRLALLHADLRATYKKCLDYLDTIKQCNHNSYCTMQSTIYVCNIEAITKNGDKYKKYPKLVELYKHLFNNEQPNNLHNALNDVVVTMRCFMKLKYDRDLITSEREDIQRLFDRIR